ncbi:hypothetical protein IZU99_08230 [Oscillospiraceae bacterium CM]|nr:hypothetical protein IZU99_08230 [Oscillospiraceae bacterium CM]
MNSKTKRIVIIASAAVAVIAVALLSIYFITTANPVLGTWSVGGENSGLTLTFDRNETVVMESNGVKTESTYVVTGDKLTKTDSDGQTMSGQFKITKDNGKTQMEWNIGNRTLKLYKQ